MGGGSGGGVGGIRVDVTESEVFVKIQKKWRGGGRVGGGGGGSGWGGGVRVDVNREVKFL